MDGAWSNEEVPVRLDSTTNNIAFFCLVIRNYQRCLQKYEKRLAVSTEGTLNSSLYRLTKTFVLV